MQELTFNELPKAVTQLSDKLNSTGKILITCHTNNKPETDQLLILKRIDEFIRLFAPIIYGYLERTATYVIISERVRVNIKSGNKVRNNKNRKPNNWPKWLQILLAFLSCIVKIIAVVEKIIKLL